MGGIAFWVGSDVLNDDEARKRLAEIHQICKDRNYRDLENKDYEWTYGDTIRTLILLWEGMEYEGVTINKTG